MNSENFQRISIVVFCPKVRLFFSSRANPKTIQTKTAKKQESGAYSARPGPRNLQAYFATVVVYWRPILSLPLAASFPLSGGLRPRNRWGLLPPLPAVALVANPSSTAQRGRGGSLPLVVRRKEGKNAGLPASVFSQPVGILPPRQ